MQPGNLATPGHNHGNTWSPRITTTRTTRTTTAAIETRGQRDRVLGQERERQEESIALENSHVYGVLYQLTNYRVTMVISH